jgi:hypothetical protein
MISSIQFNMAGIFVNLLAIVDNTPHVEAPLLITPVKVHLSVVWIEIDYTMLNIKFVTLDFNCRFYYLMSKW